MKEPLHGEPVSQMIQAAAHKVGLELSPRERQGAGVEDLTFLIIRCYNAELRTQVYAEAIKNLKTACAKGELSESAEAIITLAILNADAAYNEQKRK
jgi:hypothetical protein